MDAGGSKSRDALVGLIALAGEPGAKQLMKSSGLQASAIRLMKSSFSSSELQRLAGSIITLLTDMPVSSEISEDSSGSSGYINIVVPRPSRVYGPDQTILALDSGVQRSDARGVRV